MAQLDRQGLVQAAHVIVPFLHLLDALLVQHQRSEEEPARELLPLDRHEADNGVGVLPPGPQ